MTNAAKKTPNSDDDMLISYRTLRRVVGGIGIALPVALVVGESVLNWEFGIRESMSSYYWSVWMRDMFVASLCAIGMFLLSYRGEGWDNVAGDVACASAVGSGIGWAFRRARGRSAGRPPAPRRRV